MTVTLIIFVEIVAVSNNDMGLTMVDRRDDMALSNAVNWLQPTSESLTRFL